VGDDNIVIEGLYYDRGLDRVVPAELLLVGDALIARAADDGRTLVISKATMADVVRRDSDEHLHVELAGQWIFETSDFAGVDRLLTAPLDGIAPWLQGGWHRVLIFIAAVMVVLSMLWRFGVPAATQLAVDRTPASVEASIAEATLGFLDGGAFAATQADQYRRTLLQAEFDKLEGFYRQLDNARDDAAFQLLFRRAPGVGPNALALAGGPIVVTDELLELIEDDDLIVAILAHEMAHVHYRHSLYGLYRSAGLGALVALLSEDLTELSELAVAQGTILSNLAVSRRMEREADALGVELSLAAGRDPLALVEALDKLVEEFPEAAESSWFSTHPGAEDRERGIREAIEKAEQRQR